MPSPAKLAIVLAACLGAAPAAAATLTVYAPSSFTGKYGPGAAVKQAFEAECACTLDWVALDDGVSLLNRVRLEGARAAADIVLGLDMNLVAEARATGLFAPHGRSLDGLTVPVKWSDDVFLPFDYGHFAFVYDTQKLARPPASLKDLVDGDPAQKILIQDPRTSTPGLGLMLWVRSVYGPQAPAAWAKLKPRVLTVTKGWSEAYGLFTKGEAPMVLSYTLSPAYHMVVEKTDRYQAAAFAEGHYLQIEVMGQLKAAREPALAQRFLGFALTPAFQDRMPTGNWMWPAARTAEPLPEAFGRLVKPAKTLLFSPEEVAANRRAWTDEWLDAMTR